MKKDLSLTEEEFAERITRKEAAEFLGVSYFTMHKWVKNGTIKERGIGRKKYFLKSDLLCAVSSC